MFEVGQVEALAIGELSSKVPCVMLALTDVVTKSFPLERGLVSLRAVRGELSNGLVRELAVAVARLVGVLPPGLERDPNGWVDVPVLEPELIDRERVAWRITPELTIEHEGWGHARLVFPSEERKRVDLDADECWRLVRALVSLDVWLERVQLAVSAAATDCREQALTASSG